VAALHRGGRRRPRYDDQRSFADEVLGNRPRRWRANEDDVGVTQRCLVGAAQISLDRLITRERFDDETTSQERMFELVAHTGSPEQQHRTFTDGRGKVCGTAIADKSNVNTFVFESVRGGGAHDEHGPVEAQRFLRE
jgi:hypothetical protein